MWRDITFFQVIIHCVVMRGCFLLRNSSVSLRIFRLHLWRWNGILENRVCLPLSLPFLNLANELFEVNETTANVLHQVTSVTASAFIGWAEIKLRFTLHLYCNSNFFILLQSSPFDLCNSFWSCQSPGAMEMTKSNGKQNENKKIFSKWNEKE